MRGPEFGGMLDLSMEKALINNHNELSHKRDHSAYPFLHLLPNKNKHSRDNAM
jgi:hypothetical protein